MSGTTTPLTSLAPGMLDCKRFISTAPTAEARGTIRSLTELVLVDKAGCSGAVNSGHRVEDELESTSEDQFEASPSS